MRFEIDLSSPSPNQLALSPDGRSLAAIDASGLWVRPLDQLTGQTLKSTGGAQCPFWSPDSRLIGFFADGKLKTIDASGTPPQTLADAPLGRGGTWNRENVILFAPNAGPLYRISASGGTATPATTLDASRGKAAHLYPSFLPDGKHFIYLARSGKPENSGLYLGSIDSQETKRLVSTGVKGAFAPPRHLLFMRGETLRRRSSIRAAWNCWVTRSRWRNMWDSTAPMQLPRSRRRRTACLPTAVVPETRGSCSGETGRANGSD